VGSQEGLSSMELVSYTVAQEVRRWLLTGEATVQFWVASCEIHGGRIGAGKGFSRRFFGLPSLIVITSLLHNHLSSPPDVCDSTHHAAHYHIFGLSVEAFVPDQALG
jgi:hypothetical protein